MSCTLHYPESSLVLFFFPRLLCFYYSLNPFIHLPFYIHNKRLSVNMLTCPFVFFTFFCFITPTLLPSLPPRRRIQPFSKPPYHRAPPLISPSLSGPLITSLTSSSSSLRSLPVSPLSFPSPSWPSHLLPDPLSLHLLPCSEAVFS